MKELYHITNVGCDDVTEADFYFTDEQAEFLKTMFDELNTYSEYECMPKIYIDMVLRGSESNG